MLQTMSTNRLLITETLVAHSEMNQDRRTTFFSRSVQNS
jgi:hypothetical protein